MKFHVQPNLSLTSDVVSMDMSVDDIFQIQAAVFDQLSVSEKHQLSEQQAMSDSHATHLSAVSKTGSIITASFVFKSARRYV